MKVLSTNLISIGSNNLYGGRDFGPIYCVLTRSSSWCLTLLTDRPLVFPSFPGIFPLSIRIHGAVTLPLLPSHTASMGLSHPVFNSYTALSSYCGQRIFMLCCDASTFLFIALLVQAPQRQGPLFTHFSAPGFLLSVGSQQALCRYLSM